MQVLKKCVTKIKIAAHIFCAIDLKVIFSIVKEESTVDKAIAAVEDILGDMTKPGVGLMFVMPVDRVVGWTK